MVFATVSFMFTNVLTVGTLLLTAVATVRPVREMTWRSVMNRRIADYLGRCRDLPCPTQRAIYKRKVTQEEWLLQALLHFKDRRSFGMALAVFVTASAGLVVATCPLFPVSGNFMITGPLIVTFAAAGVNYVHAMHCMAVGSVNRIVFAALRGREGVPVVNPPSLRVWLESFRHGFGTFATCTGLDVLSLAAQLQRQNGQRWVPDLKSLDDAHRYAHQLDDDSVRRAFEQLRTERALGAATLTI